VAAYGEHRNFVIEDSTLEAANPSGWMDGLKGRNFTAGGSTSPVVDTSLIFGDNVTIEDPGSTTTRTTRPGRRPDNRTHSDSLQIRGGYNIRVRNNTFEGAANTAVMLTQDYADGRRRDQRQLAVRRLVCTVNFSKVDPPMSDVVIKDNRFGPDVGDNRCAVIAAPSQPVSLSNNVFADTGAGGAAEPRWPDCRDGHCSTEGGRATVRPPSGVIGRSLLPVPSRSVGSPCAATGGPPHGRRRREHQRFDGGAAPGRTGDDGRWEPARRAGRPGPALAGAGRGAAPAWSH
jgi:hypothetical protein